MGLAFGFGFVFGFAVAFGFGFGFAFTAEGFFVATDFVVVVAFFLGLLVVLPVCAFGLDAGFVAYERRAMLMITPLAKRPRPLENADTVWEVFITRRGLYDSCTTRSGDRIGSLDANRRTIARPVLAIML